MIILENTNDRSRAIDFEFQPWHRQVLVKLSLIIHHDHPWTFFFWWCGSNQKRIDIQSWNQISTMKTCIFNHILEFINRFVCNRKVIPKKKPYFCFNLPTSFTERSTICHKPSALSHMIVFLEDRLQRYEVEAPAKRFFPTSPQSIGLTYYWSLNFLRIYGSTSSRTTSEYLKCPSEQMVLLPIFDQSNECI